MKFKKNSYRRFESFREPQLVTGFLNLSGPRPTLDLDVRFAKLKKK